MTRLHSERMAALGTRMVRGATGIWSVSNGAPRMIVAPPSRPLAAPPATGLRSQAVGLSVIARGEISGLLSLLTSAMRLLLMVVEPREQELNPSLVACRDGSRSDVSTAGMSAPK